jgi:serine/threonine-protein kinase
MRAWIDSGLARVGVAITHAPRSPDALELRGNLRYWAWLNTLDPDPARQRARLEAARVDLEQAAALSPRQAGAWATLSHLYSQVATPAEVQIAAQRALEADEFLANADVVLGRLYTTSYDLGQFDKAGQWCRELMRRFPANALAARCRLYQLTTRVERPDIARAWRLADSTVALIAAPRRPAMRLFADMLVAAVIARASRDAPALVDSARAVVRRSRGDATIDPAREAAMVGAWTCTLLEDRDCALRLLREYLAANPARAAALREDPGWWFMPLQNDRRFQQLIGTDD